MSDQWSVVVSNVGQVFRGKEKRARAEFMDWVRISKKGQGRAAHEGVTLFRPDGEPAKEYEPKNKED